MTHQSRGIRRPFFSLFFFLCGKSRFWPFGVVAWLALAFTPSSVAGDNDFTGPQLTVTSHANGQIVNAKTIVLSGTATDAGQGGHGISSVYARGQVAGATASGNDTVNWSQQVTLSPGANYIEIYAYDNSDAHNSTTINLTINFQPLDTLPPALVVTSHQDGEVVHTKTITLSGTATDANRGNNGVSGVYVGGLNTGATATGAGTATWSQAVTLTPGANHINIYAYDNSDVQNQQTLTLLINFQPVDPLPPTLLITSHTNGQVVATSTIQLSGTATDAGRGDNGISSVYLQGTLPNVSGTGAQTVNWSKSINLYPGPNYLTVYAYDNSDVQNEASQPITIVYQPTDALAPILTINGYTNGVTVTTSSITLTGTATDAGRGDSGISKVSLQGAIPNTSVAGAGVVNWSKTISLYPGRNYITVYADDNSEFPNEASQSLTINFQPADTLGPNLVVNGYTEGQTVTTKTITLSGTASDAGRGDNGISSVSCQGKIDGATGAGAATVQWSKTIDLSPGRNFINISALDNSPFPSETDVSLTLNFQPADSLAPVLVVTSHTDGQTVFTNVVTVAGTASDAGRGDNGVTGVKVNFQPADNGTVAGAGTAHWSRTFALNPGSNNIYISAVDGAEFPNETNVTIRLIYQASDSTPPSLSIDSPRNGQTITTGSITISGTATDAGQGGSGVAQVTVNGIPAVGGIATGSGTATWSQNIALQLGANVISVVALDNSPNRNSAAATVTVNYNPVDTTGPAVAVTSHKNQQTVNTSTIALSGTATDDGSGGSGISSVTINGVRANGDTAVGSATANWSQNLPLTPGPNVLSIVARDNSPAQNSTANSITIIYDPTDTTPPSIEITSHRKSQVVSQPTVTLQGTATDAKSGDNGISLVTVNGQPADGGTAAGAAVANWSRTLTLQLGPNQISVVAQDDSPNKNSAAESITLIYEPVDITPPDLTVTSHHDGDTVATSAILLSGAASDADLGDSGIATVSVNGLVATGGTVTGSQTAHWSQALVLNPGANIISVVAVDGNHNSTAKTLTLTYDPHLAQVSQSFCWANASGGPGTDAGYAIALDPDGNTFVTGSFEGTASFATTNLTSRGFSDVFIAKYDASGALLWTRQAGGTNADAGFAIASDNLGNCYVTGYFSGSADFGGKALSTTGSYDLFVAKYDPSGNLIWATTTGKSTALYASGIAVDAAGNSYVTGSFSDIAVFGNETFANGPTYDGFVAKLDPSGALLWATQLGGDNNDQGTGVAVDANGNCYVTGYFEGQASFADQDLTSLGDQDLFLARFSTDGQLQWVQSAGAVGKTEAAAVALDPAGNALVTGYFDSAALFGTNLLSTTGFFDLFLAKFDNQGNVQWSESTGSSAINGAALAVDGQGNAYVTGSFTGPAQFGDLTLTNGAASRIFLAKFASDGQFVWAKQAGGNSGSSAYGVAVDSEGTSYMAGAITGLVDFGGKTLSTSDKSDAVVAKLVGDASGTSVRLDLQALGSLSFQVRFTGDVCGSYRLQSSSDLRQWTTILSTNAPAGPVTYTDHSAADVPYRFFRVLSP